MITEVPECHMVLLSVKGLSKVQYVHVIHEPTQMETHHGLHVHTG